MWKNKNKCNDGNPWTGQMAYSNVMGRNGWACWHPFHSKAAMKIKHIRNQLYPNVAQCIYFTCNYVVVLQIGRSGLVSLDWINNFSLGYIHHCLLSVCYMFTKLLYISCAVRVLFYCSYIVWVIGVRTFQWILSPIHVHITSALLTSRHRTFVSAQNY